MSFLTETMGVQLHRCVNVASEIVYIIYKYINININANINIHTYRRLLRERVRARELCRSACGTYRFRLIV